MSFFVNIRRVAEQKKEERERERERENNAIQEIQKGYVSARNLQCTASESIVGDCTRFRVSNGKTGISPVY